ncbi:MAG: hypothetical protein ACYC9O_12980, partial [Candidatus Latescibacterota bacterium]
SESAKESDNPVCAVSHRSIRDLSLIHPVYDAKNNGNNQNGEKRRKKFYGQVISDESGKEILHGRPRAG